jgi:hypothetical protein
MDKIGRRTFLQTAAGLAAATLLPSSNTADAAFGTVEVEPKGTVLRANSSQITPSPIIFTPELTDKYIESSIIVAGLSPADDTSKDIFVGSAVEKISGNRHGIITCFEDGMLVPVIGTFPGGSAAAITKIEGISYRSDAICTYDDCVGGKRLEVVEINYVDSPFKYFPISVPDGADISCDPRQLNYRNDVAVKIGSASYVLVSSNFITWNQWWPVKVTGALYTDVRGVLDRSNDGNPTKCFGNFTPSKNVIKGFRQTIENGRATKTTTFAFPYYAAKITCGSLDGNLLAGECTDKNGSISGFILANNVYYPTTIRPLDINNYGRGVAKGNIVFQFHA